MGFEWDTCGILVGDPWDTSGITMGDPHSGGSVEDQGTGTHCAPIVTKLNSDFYRVHAEMYSGAIYASMTGSGSTMFGLFNEQPPNMVFDPSYFCWKGQL